MNHTLFFTLGLSAILSTAVSCGKKNAATDATGALEESFKAAEPPVRQAIDTVNVHLRSKDYTAAARALVPVVSRQPLSEPERQAVGAALEQINRGIATDRSQDTKEMYELRAKLFQAVHRGGPRF